MMSTLDDDRVERIRRGVMTEVDADVRRRAGVLRKIRTTAVAGAFVVGMGGIAVPLLSTSEMNDSADAGSSAEIAADSAAPEPAPGSARLDGVAPEDVDDGARSIVITGSAIVVTSDPRDSASSLARWVEDRDGRVDARSVSRTDDGDVASLTLRVPADQVSATVDQLDEYGEVSDVNLSNDDVTASVRDLNARISALRVSTDRLERIVAATDDADELVQAEQALTDRQAQLEQLVAERRSIDERVDLATIDVSLSPSKAAASVSPGGFRGGLLDGWNALVATVDVAVTVLGALLPWLALGGLGYAAYRLTRRRAWT